MKHTAKVTTVMAIVAEFCSKREFYYPSTFFYALFVGQHYGVVLSSHEFATRLKVLLDTWSEGEYE